MMTLPRPLLATAVLVLSVSAAAVAQPPAKPAAAQASAALDALHEKLDAAAQATLPKVVTWRRHLHQTPELGNFEVQTSKYLAERLTALGYEVKTGVAKTGVVGVLRGGKPGPVVALRADMDALPVTEETHNCFIGSN